MATLSRFYRGFGVLKPSNQNAYPIHILSMRHSFYTWSAVSDGEPNTNHTSRSFSTSCLVPCVLRLSVSTFGLHRSLDWKRCSSHPIDIHHIHLITSIILDSWKRNSCSPSLIYMTRINSFSLSQRTWPSHGRCAYHNGRSWDKITNATCAGSEGRANSAPSLIFAIQSDIITIGLRWCGNAFVLSAAFLAQLIINN